MPTEHPDTDTDERNQAALTRLGELATILHRNDHDYEDCALAAAHTYESLIAHGYRARIVYGELYSLAAPHWWAEALLPSTTPGSPFDVVVVDPVSRTDDFPDPAIYQGRPDEYIIPKNLTEVGAITRSMAQHARDWLTDYAAAGIGSSPPSRPELARNPRPELHAPE